MSRAAMYVGTAPVLYLDSITSTSWTRPAWPSLSDLTSLNNRFEGVYGVENSDSNFVSLLVATDSGTYTVDWGDGTTPNSGIASNTQINHTYDYATITASPVENFKPVVVTVITSGGNITTFSLQQRHPLNISFSRINWLDIAINASAMTSLTIGGSSVGTLNKLEKATIYNHSVTNMTSIFSSCYSLQSVPLFNTSAVTNMNSMFSSCYSLQSVPLFNTSAVTNMAAMFSSCYSLLSVPLFNTISVNTMFSMFSNCSSLQSVPLFNTALVTTMFGMFTSCFALQTVPLFNTLLVTSMSSMFSECRSLQTVPLFNTISVNTMSQMFFNCTALQSVSLFNTAFVTTMFNMFNGCSLLKTAPLFNTANVSNMNNMFNNCSNLQNVPLFVTNNVNNMSGMFQNCFNLQTIPLFVTSAVQNMSNMFNSCTNLQSIPLLNTAAITSTANTLNMFSFCYSLVAGRTNGLRFGINYSNGKLSTAALNNIFTGLGTASGAQTITITNNPGAATCTRTIATAKGWTVTG